VHERRHRPRVQGVGRWEVQKRLRGGLLQQHMSFDLQQQRFDRFRREYNTVRPHEALDDETPASCYVPSTRPYPRRLPSLEYPGHFEVRRVSRNGGIRWHHAWVNVSHLLAEEYVGLEAVDEELWDVYFGPVWLGRMHEATNRIVDQFGHPARREGGNHKGKGRVLPLS